MLYHVQVHTIAKLFGEAILKELLLLYTKYQTKSPHPLAKNWASKGVGIKRATG